MTVSLRRIAPSEIDRALRPPVDPQTFRLAQEIVESVRTGGEACLRELAERFGERRPADPLVLGPEAMAAARDAMDTAQRSALEQTADRIRAFAGAQREAIREVRIPVPGGEAGHTIEPVASAGCYAPGGRYPLPSSALMTAVTARAAGCERVVVASPGAHPATLAAAAIAGADRFLAVGGAHAIAALAYGFNGFERCDVVVGPGNSWVTAAKQCVHGVVGIDMLAGPSELLVLADETADPLLVASDLLAQAEHDHEAVPMLVTTCATLPDRVDAELSAQLAALPTRHVAAEALQNGFVCVEPDLGRCVAIVDRIAPEHLEIMTGDPASVASRVRNAGAIFIGANAAEVFGDYGAGPNHTLPTGGTARFRAGLSVFDFLRPRTWLRIDDPTAATPLIDQARTLAQMEGLAGHAAAADARAVRSRG